VKNKLVIEKNYFDESIENEIIKLPQESCIIDFFVCVHCKKNVIWRSIFSYQMK